MVGVTTPDLTVESMSANSNSVDSSEMLTLTATVSNTGTGSSPVTDLRWYRSIDNSLDTAADNTPQGTDTVSILAAGEGVMVSNSNAITVPSTAGTYHYFACVDEVMDEINTNNNCSTGVMVDVTAPDLTASGISANSNSIDSSEMLTLTATVSNTGTGSSPATNLRWYRSVDNSLDTTTDNTPQGTDTVSILAAGEGVMVSNSNAITAPSTAGTYHYFACVDEVMDEINPSNNCSTGVMVDVTAPDLTASGISANSNRVDSSGMLTLTATVSNTGTGSSPATNLRWYRSVDNSLDTTTDNTPQGTDTVSILAAGEGVMVSNSNAITVPSTAGTYHYFACVDEVTDEINTNNNCSTGVMVEVTAPDLTVAIMPTSATVEASGMLTLTATVSNTGTGSSPATDLHWYLSTDNTINMSDTQLGMDGDTVNSLGPGSSAVISNTITVSSEAGTYFYGACVDTVTDESDTNNNCSPAVTVVVIIAPDLTVSISPSSAYVVPSAMRTLTATVSNAGTKPSPETTTFRWYHSADSSLNTVTDTSLTTETVRILMVSDSVMFSNTVTASTTAGTSYYFACVDTVMDEITTSNNCAPALEFVVIDDDPGIRLPTHEFTSALKAANNTRPRGIWSNGTIMWVADREDSRIYAYDLATKKRVPAETFHTLGASGNNSLEGIWSDGITMWVVDNDYDNPKIYAYNMETKARDPAKDFNTLNAAGNTSPYGIWSDGVTMWVTDSLGKKLHAYNMETKAHDWRKNINTGDYWPRGIWSNGTTIWVAVNSNGLRAYNLATKGSDSAKDISISAGIPRGVWSNGVTIWVADRDDKRVYAYNLATKARDSAKEIVTTEDVQEANEDPRGLWSNGTTLWIADSADDKLYAYSLVSKSHTPDKDFALDSENKGPEGIWSDGVTLWVSDYEDDKLYAYVLATKARDSDKDFNTLSDAGNTGPSGIWSDGVTMWVADWDDDKLYAYVLTTKARDQAKDITLETENGTPRDIWSDGVTLWVADLDDDKLYAYDLKSGNYVSDKDVTTLTAAGNTDPSGIWSDGRTMWVSDSVDDELYAYDVRLLINTN